MGRRPRITKKLFKEYIKGTSGILSLVAERFGVERSAITQFLKKHPEMEKYVSEEQEKILDVAEHKLYRKIAEGDYKCLRLMLTTKGRRRGFVEKREYEIKSQNKELTVKEKFKEFQEMIEKEEN